jgi:hypothetical protein
MFVINHFEIVNMSDHKFRTSLLPPSSALCLNRHFPPTFVLLVLCVKAIHCCNGISINTDGLLMNFQPPLPALPCLALPCLALPSKLRTCAKYRAVGEDAIRQIIISSCFIFSFAMHKGNYPGNDESRLGKLIL